jgi:hypothetical protein
MAKKVEVKTGTEEQINGVNPVTTENAEVEQKPENAENNASVNLKNTTTQKKSAESKNARVQEMPTQETINNINSFAMTPVRPMPIVSVEVTLNDIGNRVRELTGMPYLKVDATLKGLDVMRCISANPAYADKLQYILPAITAGRKFGFMPIAGSGLVQEPILYKIVVSKQEYSKQLSSAIDPTAAIKNIAKVDEERLVQEFSSVLPTDAKGMPALISTENVEEGIIEIYVDLLKVFASLTPNVRYGHLEKEYSMVIAMKGSALSSTTTAAIIAVRNDFKGPLGM